MIARVAENIYWMQRYVDRAEGTARMLSVATSMAMDSAGVSLAEMMRSVWIVSGEQERLEKKGVTDMPDPEQMREVLTWDKNPVSIVRCIEQSRNNARAARDVISREYWEALNELWLWICSDEAKRQYENDPIGFYQAVIQGSYRAAGTAAATMTQNETMNFMSIGRQLERAGQTARVLDVKHHAVGPMLEGRADTAEGTVLWVEVLVACSAYETYFRQNRGSIRGRRVARFLLLDPRFPRSVLRCSNRLLEALEHLRITPMVAGEAEEAIRHVLAKVAPHDIDTILDSGIHEYLTSVIEGLAEVNQAMYRDFFLPR